AVAIGMIVDGSIVVTENVVRWTNLPGAPQGNRLLLVGSATREVAVPILFAILIVIVVFFPLFTLEQTEGKLFKPLAATICLAMFGSLLVALLIVPVICSYIPIRGADVARNPFMRPLTAAYRPVLVWALRHRGVVMGVSLLLLCVSIVLLLRIDTEFIPPLEEGAIAVNLIRLPSASLDGSRETGLEIERLIMLIPEVVTVVSKSGRAEISEDPMGPEQSDIFVMLKPHDKWRPGIHKKDIVDAVRAVLRRIPGIRPSFSQPIALRVNELLSGIKSDIAVKVFGDDLTVLRETGARISEILSGIRGSCDVKLEQTAGFSQINVEVDRTAIARHGLNIADLNDIIETAVGGKVVTWLLQGRQRTAVLLRFPLEQREDMEDVRSILVPTPNGYHVPLGALAAVREVPEEEGPAQISHEKNMRRIVVECNVRDRAIGSFVEETREKLRAVEGSLPSGCFLEMGGQFENQERAQSRLNLIVPVSVLLIFALLTVSLGSARGALLVILNLPLAMIGGVFGLYVSGLYLSVPASIGFIALFGTAVENGLVLVSYISQTRAAGTPLDEAVVNCAVVRLRPVLMTAVTTCLGLLPLLFASGPGAEVQRPLAAVVVGGLITSTALTLLVLPCLYGVFERKT
ncbi:MAG: efflux RND transporter permease subunit, partial [Planctomycetota bacterium]|nr:efflux RND transporter permease subunit [Planctomycetota bacterium]